MRATARTLALLVALVGLAVPTTTGSSAPPPALRGGGFCGASGTSGHTDDANVGDGLTHRYHWRVPATSAPAAGRPVLIWLHGDGGDGTAIAPKFWPSTDPDGAIVITPDGTGRTWNHRVADVAGTPHDTKFLSRIVGRLVACASVDPARIFVGGSSRGAFMAYYLLQREANQERIAAVAVNAGLLYCQDDDTLCEADTSHVTRHAADARILHLHGTDDRAVAPPPTARYHDPVDWDVDWRVFFPMKLWAEQHGCWTGAVGGPNNGRLRATYDVGVNAARVYDLTGHGAACDDYQLTLVTRGGHVIDGQEARIWAFLMDRPFAAPPTCRGEPATIVGTSGPDVLEGTGSADVIAGLGGNDTIHGRGGADRVCGGRGADRMYGDAGRDRLGAKDGTADRRIDCGAGADLRAERDAVDPRALSC